MLHLHPDVVDFSDLLVKIPNRIEAIAFIDKTIRCDLLVTDFIAKHGVTSWKNLGYSEMGVLSTLLELRLDIASTLKVLEHKTKESSKDRASKFTNYVSAQTGEMYPNWQSLPENYLLILENKIKAAIAGLKTA